MFSTRWESGFCIRVDLGGVGVSEESWRRQRCVEASIHPRQRPHVTFGRSVVAVLFRALSRPP